MTRAIACLGASLLCALSCLPSAARADEDPARLQQLEQRLEKSLAKIEALEARVHELESKQGAGPAVATVAAAPAPAAVAQAAVDEKVEALQSQVEALNRANASRQVDESSLPIHGFADIGVGNHNQNFPAEKGFNVAELDFYLTPQLGTHTKALFELNFETDQSGDLGADLERAQLGYEFNDYATLWVGRFHTPYGYYNTAYHHGRWLMLDLRRPRFLEFEDHGGAMPAHTVGAWLTGRAPLGDGKLTYDGYFGNGQRLLETQSGQGEIDMNSIGNAHGNAIYGGRLGYEFAGGLDGINVGIDAFSTKIGDDQVAPNLTQVTSYGAYVLYDTDSWEFLSEFHAFHDTDLSGSTGTHNSHAAFADLAYRLGQFAPYLRWEQASFDQGDQFFLQQQFGNSYRRDALGLRFDIDLKSVIKLELAHTWDLNRVRDQYNDVLAQYAIRF